MLAHIHTRRYAVGIINRCRRRLQFDHSDPVVLWTGVGHCHRQTGGAAARSAGDLDPQPGGGTPLGERPARSQPTRAAFSSCPSAASTKAPARPPTRPTSRTPPPAPRAILPTERSAPHMRRLWHPSRLRTRFYGNLLQKFLPTKKIISGTWLGPVDDYGRGTRNVFQHVMCSLFQNVLHVPSQDHG
jgi:hypothetical protein